MSGFAINLVITYSVKKAAYDALPKTKTVRQALQEVQTSQGLFISLFSPQSMDDNITNKEYQSLIPIKFLVTCWMARKYEIDLRL